MTFLATFARYEVGVLITAFAAVVIYQLLTGRINTRGLLSEKTNAGLGGVSPARVQLLLFTLAMAVYVLSEIVKLHKFPEIQTKWLLMLGGSHSIFLTGKGVFSLFSSDR
jgi:hypothetical protein